MDLVVYCNKTSIYYNGPVWHHNFYKPWHILQCQDTLQTVQVELLASLSSCSKCITF